MENHGIYDHKRRLELLEKRIEKEISSAKNQKTLTNYKNDCLAQGTSLARVVRTLEDLLKIDKILKKDFELATIDDIKSLIVKLDQAVKKNQENYSEHTKYGFKISIKKFYKWLRGNDEYPEEVKWIKVRLKLHNNKLPQELLTEEDIKKLVESADNPRDKALVFLLYESGCRIAEILTLKLKHITFDEYGAVILVEGKTGQRRVRVISSTPYLTDWLNNHPFKDNSEALLWVTRGYKRKELGYQRVRHIFKQLKLKSKVQKKVNPHNFRHSRATFLANHLTEAQLKEHFGWVKESDMASVYVHLSGRDVDNALLKIYGIENNGNNKESILKLKTCLRCKEVNPPTNQFCSKCGIPLDKEAVIETIENDMKRKIADEILDKLILDKQFLDILLTKIKEVKKDDV